MKPADFIRAAKCPAWLPTGTFGLWRIERKALEFTLNVPPDIAARMGLERPPTIYQTILWRTTAATLHLVSEGEIVMEDSPTELMKHLPIWMMARGSVLVTGLGLGCVVRGLLANPAVDHIDVVEIDATIIRLIGPEFFGNKRVKIHHGDAIEIEFPPERRWNFAWHDLWTETGGRPHLQILHAMLYMRFKDRVGHQGAWAFPRFASRMLPFQPLGAPRRRGRDWRWPATV